MKKKGMKELMGAAVIAAAAMVGKIEYQKHDIDTEPKKTAGQKADTPKEKKPIGEGLRLSFDNSKKTSAKEDDKADGGFGGEETETSTETLKGLIYESLPNIHENREEENITAGDYLLKYNEHNQEYEIKQFTKKEEADKDDYQRLRGFATVKQLEDGSYVISNKQPDTADVEINCKKDDLPNALKEYAEFRELLSGDIDSRELWQISTDIEHGQNINMDNLLKVQKYYEEQARNIRTILSKDWDFIMLNIDIIEKYQSYLTEYDDKLIEIQRKIIDLTSSQ